MRLSSGIVSRLMSHATLKFRCSLVACAVFAVGYFPLGRFPLLTPRTLPLTRLDELFPFRSGWVVVYHSMYPLLLGVAWLSTQREGVLRYTRALVVQMLACFAVFALFPVIGPRPRETGDLWVFQVAATLDTPLNSFPSLHASFLVTALLHAWRPLRTGGYRVILGGAAVWATAVLASTLYTKQHYAVDLAAGAAVGCVSYWLAGRLWQAKEMSAASDASKSHAGRR